MDFEAIRARVDDVVTGLAADVTETILDVVDDALTMVETAQYQAEQMKDHQTGPFQFNFDGAMSADDIRAKVSEAVSRMQGQAKPASAAGKTGGSSKAPSKDELVRNIYNYLVENYSVYEEGSDAVGDYIVNSSFEEDRLGLLQDLATYWDNEG